MRRRLDRPHARGRRALPRPLLRAPRGRIPPGPHAQRARPRRPRRDRRVQQLRRRPGRRRLARGARPPAPGGAGPPRVLLREPAAARGRDGARAQGLGARVRRRARAGLVALLLLARELRDPPRVAPRDTVRRVDPLLRGRGVGMAQLPPRARPGPHPLPPLGPRRAFAQLHAARARAALPRRGRRRPRDLRRRAVARARTRLRRPRDAARLGLPAAAPARLGGASLRARAAARPARIALARRARRRPSDHATI